MKIELKNPLVEMDGDEMTRVLWKMVKEKLLLPHLELQLEYYDLGLESRDRTDDQITIEAANAIKKHKVGVKCATITPDAGRVTEYGLKQQWKSPNGTIRSILDGTVFRRPIMARNIVPAVRNWKKPIVLGRHAYGDVYKNVEMAVDLPGKVELVYTDETGKETRALVHRFEGPGVVMGIHNLRSSIESFARACFEYALDSKIDMIMSSKDTISKIYHATFRKVFQEIYHAEYESRFADAGISYLYTLIDDAVARVIKSEGGMLWACRNYDGDVMSDMVASAFGSLAMMTSELVSPHGYFEFEAAHGTVQRHYYLYKKGEKTSTNSMATIFAWTGALRKRGEMDGVPAVVDFASKLESAAIETIESGVMTKDLLNFSDPKPAQGVDSEQFIDAIAERLAHKLGA